MRTKWRTASTEATGMQKHKTSIISGRPKDLLPLLLVAFCLVQLPKPGIADGSATEQRVYSAVCIVAQNENEYIAEWLDYHRCLGIGKVYLYDHNSTTPMSTAVKSYVDDGFVEYINFNGEHTKWQPSQGFSDSLSKFSATIQGKAYQDCLTRFSDRHNFMGFIDVDEFVVLHDPSLHHIDDLLKRYEAFAGVSFYWQLFGSSGHQVKQRGSVTMSYLKCLPRDSKQNTQFKSFVNTAYRPTMYTPHRALFAADLPHNFLVDENYVKIAPGRNKNSSHGVAAIYHYVTKSKQDFRVKVGRGGGAGVTRPKSYLAKLDEGCVDTCYDAALQYARLCGLDKSNFTKLAGRVRSAEQQELQRRLMQVELKRTAARRG